MLMHHQVPKCESIYTWEEPALLPFDELIVSWNAARPQKGRYAIAVSLKIKEWTPWLDYAVWGAADQFTFDRRLPHCQTFQDIVEVLDGEKATGFRVRVKAEEGAALHEFRMLHAAFTNRAMHSIEAGFALDDSPPLAVPGLSQMQIPHERHKSFCSPTSLTAVINYLQPALQLAPQTFAERVKDTGFDIYGNWIFNTAESSHLGVNCYVARLSRFEQIVAQLQKGYPVIVSVRGPLSGSAMPYDSGHLMVVKGYQQRVVYCMDPAFPDHEETSVQYPLEQFLQAWGRRQGIAYMFQIF